MKKKQKLRYSASEVVDEEKREKEGNQNFMGNLTDQAVVTKTNFTKGLKFQM